jgi:hypothetical protein
MSERPIAYVMEQTLGSITHYLNLRREESAAETPKPFWIPIEHRQSRVPWTLTASWLTRRALGAVLNDIDGIFMHTTTLAPLSVDYFSKKPTILSTDGTPLNKRDMRRAYGLPDQGRLGERAKRVMHGQVFRSAAGLVAWSHWTKQSFVEDYGCREEDVVIIAASTWTSSRSAIAITNCRAFSSSAVISSARAATSCSMSFASDCAGAPS